MLDFKTASTIATSTVQAKLDNCNSHFLSIDTSQSTAQSSRQYCQNYLKQSAKSSKPHFLLSGTGVSLKTENTAP